MFCVKTDFANIEILLFQKSFKVEQKLIYLLFGWQKKNRNQI